MHTIQDHVPQAFLADDIGSEITCLLPKASNQDLSRLVSNLEGQQDALGIESFGLSVTTMEEVFLNVGKGTSNTLTQRRSTIRDAHKRGMLRRRRTCSLVSCVPPLATPAWRAYMLPPARESVAICALLFSLSDLLIRIGSHGTPPWPHPLDHTHATTWWRPTHGICTSVVLSVVLTLLYTHSCSVDKLRR